MATEITLTLENKPGTLAATLDVLAEANINLEGVLGIICEGQGIVQMVTSNPDGAVAAFKAAGIKYLQREVLLVNLKDMPGSLAAMVNAMADMGININGIYITAGDRLALGVDNIDNARLVAAELGIIDD